MNKTQSHKRGDNCFSRINTTEKGHSLGNAYLFALTSHYMYPHAYSPNTGNSFSKFKKKAEKLFYSWGMPSVDLHEEKNVQYGVMSNETTIIVAFRGSDAVFSKDGFEDWVATDAFAIQKKKATWGQVTKKDPGVHTGFANAYWMVRNRINSSIKSHGGNSKKLFITGHSLGGALAVLCAIDQGYATNRPGSQRYKAQGVYIYGAPRVGNGLFKKLYDSKTSAGGARALNTHRYVNYNDIFPMFPGDTVAHDAVYVPITHYGFGERHDNVKYIHTGRTSNIKKDGKIVRDDREYRGAGSILAHHSKKYAHKIFNASIKPKSWASSMPLPPKYPSKVRPN